MSSAGIKCQELHNAHDPAALAAILAPGCTIVFGEQGEQIMEKDDYVQVYKALVASFPDILFDWSDTNELSNGTVTCKCIVSGTHKGAPFGFGSFPPIEATGTKCQNDPEDMDIIVQGDLVTQMKVVPTKGSPKTGPPGFYLQIGGKMG